MSLRKKGKSDGNFRCGAGARRGIFAADSRGICVRKVRFVVRSRRPTFLLNRLLVVGVLLDKIQIDDGSFCFFVFRKDVSTVEKTLIEWGAEYQKTDFGAKTLLRRVFSRPFLAVASLVAVLGVLVFSNFVYGYSVKGNFFVNTACVEEVLRVNGVKSFVWKNKLDLAAIKRDVGAIEGVSFASVRLVGGRLQVEIKEELPPKVPDTPLFVPVTSACSAVVTKIVAESGTPQVKAGDKVRQGDVLIAPAYAFTEGEAPAPARGEVWGVVTYKKEVLLPLFTVESVLTGETFCVREVYLFGKKIGGDPVLPFEDYDEEEVDVYRGFGVTVKQKTYRRRVSQTVYHDFDAEAPRLLAEGRAELLLTVPYHARERVEVRAVQKKLDNVLYIVLYYSVEQRIDLPFVARSASVEEYG